MEKITAKELAARLDGREYFNEITYKEIMLAKENGLVVVYGYGYDKAIFQGAIVDEDPYFFDGLALLTKKGVMPCPTEEEEKIGSYASFEILDPDDCGGTWQYETSIPHETFWIYKDGEPFCRGIVFSIEDLPNSIEQELACLAEYRKAYPNFSPAKKGLPIDDWQKMQKNIREENLPTYCNICGVPLDGLCYNPYFFSVCKTCEEIEKHDRCEQLTIEEYKKRCPDYPVVLMNHSFSNIDTFLKTYYDKGEKVPPYVYGTYKDKLSVDIGYAVGYAYDLVEMDGGVCKEQFQNLGELELLVQHWNKLNKINVFYPAELVINIPEELRTAPRTDNN